MYGTVLEVINCKLGQTEGAHYTTQAAAAELSSMNSATGLATIGGVNFVQDMIDCLNTNHNILPKQPKI